MSMHLKGNGYKERTDILGHDLFNGLEVYKTVSREVALKILQAVSLSIFSSIALLQSIDLNVYALNDQTV